MTVGWLCCADCSSITGCGGWDSSMNPLCLLGLPASTWVLILTESVLTPRGEEDGAVGVLGWGEGSQVWDWQLGMWSRVPKSSTIMSLGQALRIRS